MDLEAALNFKRKSSLGTGNVFGLYDCDLVGVSYSEETQQFTVIVLKTHDKKDLQVITYKNKLFVPECKGNEFWFYDGYDAKRVIEILEAADIDTNMEFLAYSQLQTTCKEISNAEFCLGSDNGNFKIELALYQLLNNLQNPNTIIVGSDAAESFKNKAITKIFHANNQLALLEYE